MLTTLLLLAASAAQAVPAANENEIEEVLVTATRRVVSARDISSGLTVVGQHRVRSEKLVTDALAANVGVFLQQTTPGQGAAIIRGLKGSSILHLVDGLRLNNAIFRSAPTQYLSLVPVTAIERVELLRGTPASLYGNDAVGGVVQLVTRRPRFESSQTEARGEVFALFDSAELARTTRATIDVGNMALASSLSVEYLATGNRRTGAGERIGPSGYESHAARFVVAGDPAADRSWLFDVHYLEQPETPRVDELIPGFGQREASSSEFFFSPNRRVFVRGQYAKTNGPAGLDWRTDLAWQRIDDDRVTRGFAASERRRESNSSDLYGLTISGSRTTDVGSWIVGADFYNDRVQSRRVAEDVLSAMTQSVASRFPDGSKTRQAAVYANAQRLAGTRHTISGGVRLSNDRISLPATAVSSATEIDSTDVSADIGWMFELDPRWRLVANAGLGFRAPNVFDLGTLGNRPGNRFNVPNTSLDAERVLQGDLGFRYQSERLHFELLAYTLRYEDRITSVGTGDVTDEGRDVVTSVNAAESSIRGVEMGIDARFAGNFSLRGALNYTRGEQEIEDSGVQAADRIPPLNGSLVAAWDAGSARLEAWLRFADGQDRLSDRDVDDVRIDPDGTPGWAVIGARLQKDHATDWLLSLSIDNLLDRRYRVHGSGLDAPGRSLVFGVRRTW